MVASLAGGVARIVVLLLVSAGAARADGLAPLPIDADAAIAAATATGLLSSEDFEAVDDPFAGPLQVGRPAAENGAAVSVVLFEGADGLEQIQIILSKPWGDLVEKVEIAGALLRPLVSVPDPNPVLAETPRFAGMSREAQWVLGLLSECWAGWPGSPERQVRVLDGIAVIAEGKPPDYWALTIAVDAGYADINWPGPDPQGESDAVRQARQALRAGRYQDVHDLLRPDGVPDDPAALTMLGDLYRFARLGQTNQQTAADYYLRAGRTQYPEAVYALAVMTDAGMGVLTLDGLRFPLLETAAENGSADALFILSAAQEGVFYQRPEGISPMDQLHQAALLNLLPAQVDLANRYARGEGIAADPVAAYAWALVALDNTDPGIDWIRSRQVVDEMSQGLSGKQRADAHAMAEALIAEIGD